jgi:hypothetical protein
MKFSNLLQAKKWIKALHNSPKITAIREKYIEIDDQLENLPRGEKRTKLCNELFKIRDLDFSGIDFSEIGSNQTSNNSTT